MGEIGRDRREYLYEMSYCDILLIQRGYRRRNVLQYQLQRLQAYGAFHCIGGSKKEPQEWLPMYFDHYKANDAPPISEEEIEDIQMMMQQINENSGK
ncbi:MAG: hypothetical protein IKP63_05795 [Paludibacteraceae bacterium]|nr:hypothetical protein [Paludibacteraceae bacterium]